VQARASINIVTVKQALKRDDVKIVSFDWLNGCLSNGRKVSTRPYEWAKLDKTVLKKQKQKEKLRAKQNKKEQESYAQAFGEHVGQFTGPHDGTHDASFGNNEDEATTRAKQAFRKGAKAASQDLLSGQCSPVVRWRDYRLTGSQTIITSIRTILDSDTK